MNIYWLIERELHKYSEKHHRVPSTLTLSMSPTGYNKLDSQLYGDYAYIFHKYNLHRSLNVVINPNQKEDFIIY